MDIMSYEMDKITNGERVVLSDPIVKSILEENGDAYVESTGEESFISKNGGHEILYSDLYTKTGGYEVGDYIDINGEGFYVIADSPAEQDTVKMMAAMNVDTSTYKQSLNAPNIVYSTEYGGYAIYNQYENSSIQYEVASYVSGLGVPVVEGRLLLMNELKSLLGETEEHQYWYGASLDTAPAFVNATRYWTGFPYPGTGSGVCVIAGNCWSGADYFRNESTGEGYGLRPVIEVNKNYIE